jgi:ankyrin repeat protein
MSELFAAIEAHDRKRVGELLQGGADANAIQPQAPGWRPLHAAIEELEFGGPIDVLDLLLQHGADVNGWDAERDATPLLMAVYRGQDEAVRRLLAAGADPNVRGAEGDSALRWCVEHGNLPLAELLLRQGADQTINEFGGPCGLTALGLAARQLSLPFLKLLLDAGADPAALDEDYRTARERVPPRESADPAARLAALELLAGRTAQP